MNTLTIIKNHTLSLILLLLAVIRLQGRGWLMVDLCVVAVLVVEFLV